MKPFWRTGDEVEKLTAEQEIKWLDETGFWSLVAKNIEGVIKSIYSELKSESNTRDKDMFKKGELRGIQRAMIEIDRVKKNLQRNRGG